MSRRKGYASYYDYRLHGSGRTPPGSPLPARGERQAARGHAGPIGLLGYIQPGSLILLTDGIAEAARKDDQGRFILVRKTILREGADRSRTFTIRRYTVERMRSLIEAEEAKGGVFSYAPSQDQRRLVTA